MRAEGSGDHSILGPTFFFILPARCNIVWICFVRLNRINNLQIPIPRHYLILSQQIGTMASFENTTRFLFKQVIWLLTSDLI